MATWRCKRCRSENRADAAFCPACGAKRPEVGADAGAPSGLSLRRRSRSILDGIKKELADAMGEDAGVLEGVTAEMPDLSAIDIGMPRLETPARSRAPLAPEPLFQRVTTRDLRVEVDAYPRLNYALVHCGLPLIETLRIHNTSAEPANDVMVKAWLATDYGEAWQKTIPTIPAGAAHEETGIVVPLRKSRLQEVREAEKANLRVDVFTEGEVQFSETYPMEVLAYNEWYYNAAIAGLLACFVQPNSEPVEKIVTLMRDRLRREFKATDLSGYQSGSREKVVEMLEALYGTLQQDLRISYINPPPSFERGQRMPDGSVTLSQKVFFPEQIYEHRRGTCLDLTLLCAACVERMGLHPVCFIIKGHAFFGAWLEDYSDPAVSQSITGPVIRQWELVRELVTQELILPMNSVTFTMGGRKGFDVCTEEGRQYLESEEIFWCMVDVALAHRTGFKPIPPLVADR